MISPAERARLVSAAGETIERGSRSFAMASRLFDRPTRDRAWLLYAWCRHCDDVCDGQTLGHDASAVDDPLERLTTLERGTAMAIRGERTGIDAFDGLAVVAAECGLPADRLNDHLDGFALDAAGWRPRTEADLLRYCYHVAGAVGCLMAVVMGVAPDEEETLDRASDLGIAFQLANIARDIVDDDAVGRCYIPEDWLDEYGLEPGTLAAPDQRRRLARVGQRLGDLAARYEQSGRTGSARLPFRARWAVLTAAGIYGDIGRLVAARGEHAWDERVSTPASTKISWALSSLAGATRNRPAIHPRDGLWTAAEALRGADAMREADLPRIAQAAP